jgi:hypothetical protein
MTNQDRNQKPGQNQKPAPDANNEGANKAKPGQDRNKSENQKPGSRVAE